MSTAEHQAASPAAGHVSGSKPIDEEAFEIKTSSDLGKVALFVALLAVILMVMLYFSQQQNIVSMSEKLDEVQGVKQELVEVKDQIASSNEHISTVQQNVAGLEQEMETLRDLPEQARKVILTGLLKESASKIQYLSSQVENADQQEKLAQIQKMLEEVQSGLE